MLILFILRSLRQVHLKCCCIKNGHYNQLQQQEQENQISFGGFWNWKSQPQSIMEGNIIRCSWSFKLSWLLLLPLLANYLQLLWVTFSSDVLTGSARIRNGGEKLNLIFQQIKRKIKELSLKDAALLVVWRWPHVLLDIPNCMMTDVKQCDYLINKDKFAWFAILFASNSWMSGLNWLKTQSRPVVQP